MSRFYKLEAIMKERVPGFQIKFKDESTFMKVLGKIMFFNKEFMTSYVTTIGKTVYFPSRAELVKDPESSFYTLCHEYVHVADYEKRPIRFILGFIFPQILTLISLFAILAVINPYFLFFLLSLLFLAPIPAPFRTNTELRGYGMSCKAMLWDRCPRETISHIIEKYYVKNFTGANYYFMCPCKNYVIKELNKWADFNCQFDSNPAFMDVYNLITNENI